jgi:hypothetical protein
MRIISAIIEFKTIANVFNFKNIQIKNMRISTYNNANADTANAGEIR